MKLQAVLKKFPKGGRRVEAFYKPVQDLLSMALENKKEYSIAPFVKKFLEGQGVNLFLFPEFLKDPCCLPFYFDGKFQNPYLYSQILEDRLLIPYLNLGLDQKNRLFPECPNATHLFTNAFSSRTSWGFINQTFPKLEFLYLSEPGTDAESYFDVIPTLKFFSTPKGQAYRFERDKIQSLKFSCGEFFVEVDGVKYPQHQDTVYPDVRHLPFFLFGESHE